MKRLYLYEGKSAARQNLNQRERKKRVRIIAGGAGNPEYLTQEVYKRRYGRQKKSLPLDALKNPFKKYEKTLLRSKVS